MKRTQLIRISALMAAVALFAACDQRTDVTGNIIGGGGGGGGGGGSGGNKPTIVIDTPIVGTLVNIGDSILVTMRIHDDSSLSQVLVSGLTIKGSAALGTLIETNRFVPMRAPQSGVFRANLRDTVIKRYLKAAVPVDTTVDSVVVRAVVIDQSGNRDSASRTVYTVSGPAVNILAPSPGDSIPAGVGMTVSARAQHGDGVVQINMRVQGEAGWPTRLDTTIVTTYTTAPKDITASGIVRIPANAPVRGRITVTASATDINRSPGSATPVVAFVRNAGTAQPRVTQIVPTRIELTDSITVTAVGDGIRSVGFVVFDSTGLVQIKRDSIILPQPYVSNVQVKLGLNLSNAEQGRHLKIISFAVDQLNRTGYSLRVSTMSPTALQSQAWSDTTVVVFGTTFKIPNMTANTIVGDIAVDAARGNVFLTNINNNKLEVWQNGSKSFDPIGVAVGSLPWGLAVGGNPDTLFVANSGGTNVSRVFIGSTTVSSIREVLAQRMLTRNTYIFQITEARDANTGKISLSVIGPISYSDRPQYIAVAQSGRIYYSTRPTQANVAGTIRWVDPSYPAPDPQQIWQYGSGTGSTGSNYALFNVDSLAIIKAPQNSSKSDQIVLYDHPYGQLTGSAVAVDSMVADAVVKLNGQGSDAEVVLNLDINSLALTDTTFVAASGDRAWIAFGEGNTGRPGRVMMVNDPVGPRPGYFSPSVSVLDLTDNASSRVFGLAVDSTGTTVGSHGEQTFLSEVQSPFDLRLQGMYDSFDNGAGIAFHPRANGRLTVDPNNRLAFVASQGGTIEIIDVAYFINRGKLTIKGRPYGPLRASAPLPGDPANVVLKLYTMTTEGLVVVDLTAADIKPAP